MKLSGSKWVLVAILLVGGVVRFGALDAKPLWLDEVITALFGLGHSYYDVPLEKSVPISALAQIFSVNAKASCAQIVETVSVQSVHPPLFFCWLHGWLGWVEAWPVSWVWKLRSFPALVGVVAIAALYQFNRVAFSRQAGWAGAAMMAVSPFAVYLSQEARHYTLPMLLVILALLGLDQILRDLPAQRIRPGIWLGWIAVNSLGFYVHYFFLLAFVPQVVILGWGTWAVAQVNLQLGSTGADERPKFQMQNSWAIPVLGAIATVCLTYVPWIPTFVSHMGRPETDWMQSPAQSWLHAIAPLYQIPLGWVLMVVALPVEQQPPWLAIPAASVMLVFSGWLVARVVKGLRHLWRSPDTRQATWMLLVFLGLVILEFLAIAYLLGKDITLIPRYNFIYFPAICALLGASLTPSKNFQTDQAIWIVLLVGLISSVCVTSNLVFQKSYNPDQVARDMAIDPTTPRLVSFAYSDFQDVALGLSFALGLHRQYQSQPQPTPETQFVFMAQFQGYEPVWQHLAVLEQPLFFPLNLWAVSPGLKRGGYHAQLALRDRTGTPHACLIDPAHFHRIGIPYQLYRCR